MYKQYALQILSDTRDLLDAVLMCREVALECLVLFDHCLLALKAANFSNDTETLVYIKVLSTLSTQPDQYGLQAQYPTPHSSKCLKLKTMGDFIK